MTFTSEQKEVVMDLINFIKNNEIETNNEEDFNAAFLDYLKRGSLSHFYLQVADEFQKEQFVKRLSKNLQ